MYQKFMSLLNYTEQNYENTKI